MVSRTPLLLADEAGVAACRVRFLTAEPVEPGHVRGSIMASWHRSQLQAVVADQIALDQLSSFQVDSPLTRSAEPVLRDLRERLDGQPVSIILTDQTGLVLRRLTADRDLERRLDSVKLAPGFSYAEKDVGTNGIGTALEVGGPTHVFGHEHYAENLEEFGCAGVPIKHPVSGRTVGAIDLTCWRKDAGPLLLTLAKTTAEQIRQALMSEVGGDQMALFQEYLRTCRRMTGAVFALNGDVVMMNDFARSALDPADQATLLDYATDSLLSGRTSAVAVALPTGLAARLYCRPVPVAGPGAGVVHVRLGAVPTMRHSRSGGGRIALPGLVGGAPLWLRACDEVDRVVKTGEWLAVQGEPGVGKMALLRAVHAHGQLSSRLLVLDAADAATVPTWLDIAASALQEDGRHVVIRHIDELDGRRQRSLAALLEGARAREDDTAPWVGVTLARATGHEAFNRLLQMFPSSVEVPPLRLHSEDIGPLIEHFLSRLGNGDRLVAAPDAVQLLTRATWPGNIDQLQAMLRSVAKHRRSGTIRLEDLPADARMVSRRRLSPLESMERDAILAALSDARGDKVAAAGALGMSRATIYRKLHAYGIVVPTS